MAKIDVVIEVLDARLPGASSNPMIEELRLHRQRPRLKILNKSDLADPAVTRHQSRYDPGDHMELIDTPGLLWRDPVSGRWPDAGRQPRHRGKRLHRRA